MTLIPIWSWPRSRQNLEINNFNRKYMLRAECDEKSVDWYFDTPGRDYATWDN